MKKQNIKFLLALFISMLGTKASAHDIEKNGIYYLYTNDSELGVSYRGTSSGHYGNEYYGIVVIPETVTYGGKTYSVTSIKEGAFSDCSNLTSVTIPMSVTSIEKDAFSGCSSLTKVHISDLDVWCKLYFPNSAANPLSYAHHLYMDGEEVKELVIPNSVTTIKFGAFYGCSGLTSVTIPNSVTSIRKSAFYRCSGLTSVTIPNSVTSIAEYAFEDCSSLKELIIEDGTTPLAFSSSDASNTFSNCPIETLHLGRDFSYDGTTPFKGKKTIKVVTIGNKTLIGSSAFENCIGLTSITIPNSVTSIGGSAFRNCDGLTSVTIPNSVTSIGDDAFRNCDGLMSVTIPNSVTSIGGYAFAYCVKLGSVTFGTGVLSIGSSVFGNQIPGKVIWLTNTPPSGYTNAAGRVNYVANDQYTSLGNKTVYPFLSSMFVVDGIKYVPVSMSERTCEAIDCVYDETAKDIHLLPSVSYKGVELAVNDFKPYLFYNNNFVETVSIEAPLQSIRGTIFQGCSSLMGISFPNSVITIEDYAFARCTSMNTISIPNSVNTIGNYAFSECTSMKTFQIEDRDEEITLGSNGSSPLFADCPLDYVYIGGNITYNTGSSYGYSPFYRNTTLREVVITDKEAEISANEFYGCTNLQNFTVGDGLTSFGDRAFSGCSNLKSLSFGSQLQSIGQEAFSDCTSITEITSLAATPPVCGINALKDISKWDCAVHVPKNSLADYQAADQWKDFLFMNGDSGSGEAPHVDQSALVISEAGFATYSPTVDVDFTTLTDVKAYIASGFNRETGALTMTRVYDVPAGTGLVVKGAAGIHEVPQSPSASIYSNLLRGSTVERNLSASAGGYVNYVLGKIGDEVGFCLVPAEGMTLAAGRAYLTIPGETAASRSALKLRFDDEEEATGVSDVERQENGASTVYDLQGRRVEQPRSGLYIRGGKKVIIK